MTRVSHCALMMAAGMVALSSGRVVGQTDITKQQRGDYAKLFQAMKAEPDELHILLEAQEKRLSVPADLKKFKDFLDSSPSSMALKQGLTPVLGALLRWNEVALDATALDSATTDATVPDASFFGEQYGPPRTSRVMAIVHLAMFEAVNTISDKYDSYKGVQATIIKGLGLPAGEIKRASKNRAIIEAAYQALVMLYPKKKYFFDNARDVSLGSPEFSDPSAPAVVVGAQVGAAAAKAILDLRYLDGSDLPDLSSDDFKSPDPLKWHQDPISKTPSALGGNWPRLEPFVIAGGEAYRKFLPGPPAQGTPDFIAAFKETKRLGGDPNAPEDDERSPTKTDRTGAADPVNPMPPDNTNQTFVGIFWAYDGSAYLCAPPRLYNMIATSVALKEKPITTVEEFSYYLAFLNATLADAAIVAWDGKYHFIFPRPITMIRELKADETPEGARDPFWTPLGAQATNGVKETRNVSPPFPAYPSGHAVFGGALFRAMQRYFRSVDPNFPDAGIAFDFVSDEYNGHNFPPGGRTPRAKVVAHFTSFKDAEKYNADSRIYLGVHWRYDVVDGTKAGNAVAEDTSKAFPQPKK